MCTLCECGVGVGMYILCGWIGICPCMGVGECIHVRKQCSELNNTT